jgi:hypothetical protein
MENYDLCFQDLQAVLIFISRKIVEKQASLKPAIKPPQL